MSVKIDQNKDKSSIDYYKVKRDLATLKSKHGYHTELLSVYIPSNRQIEKVIGYLRNEISESSNIKSKSTRQMVTDAITSIIARLKVLSDNKIQSPTGFILFDGFIPRHGPGTEEEEKYFIIPPEPVTTFMYHCASEFLTEPLEGMIKEKGTFGLISIERNESAIATLRGKQITIIESMTSGIHGKHNMGGQSQHRFERLIEEAAHEFYKRTAEHANTAFMDLKDDLEGILIGGPGLTKEEFLDGPWLRDELKKKVLYPLLDTDGGGEIGVRLLLQKGKDILRETEFQKEKVTIDKFMDNVARDTGMIIYGLRETIDAIQNAAVDTVLISEGLNKVRISRTCNGCKKEDDYFVHNLDAEKKIEQLTTGECPDCKVGFVNAIIEKKDAVEYLGDIAEKSGAGVRMISTSTEEGKMFQKTFGGIGGFLRYRYNR